MPALRVSRVLSLAAGPGSRAWRPVPGRGHLVGALCAGRDCWGFARRPATRVTPRSLRSKSCKGQDDHSWR
eukprot:1682933-Pyramimonas_sp.AAC.1